MKICVLAEKPSQARQFYRPLLEKISGEKMINKGDYFESESYYLSWFYGHLMHACEPVEYDEKYKKWLLEDLPIMPDKIKYRYRDAEIKKRGDVLLKLCNEADIKFTSACYGPSQLSLNEMPYFYEKSDIHVCMSKNEGLNNPLMESGSMGLAPISTNSGAATEMISNGESGLIINRDVDSLVNAINIMKNDNKRISMAKAFHNEIVSQWSWDYLIQDFIDMFEFYENSL